MAGFCAQCGAPIGQEAKFCTICGVKSDSRDSLRQPTPQVNATGRATAKGAEKSGNQKAVFAVLGGVFVLAVLSIGGTVYVGYRGMNKANQLRKEYGLDSFLRETGRTAKGSLETEKENHSAEQRDACNLISKEEIASASGTTFSVATLSEDRNVCTYEPGDESVVTVVVDIKWRDGNLAMRALPGFTAQLGQEDIRHPVQGIGDEAYLLGVDEETQQRLDKASEAVKGLSSSATGPLVFRKREVWVVITATMAENKAAVQKKIAQIIEGRI